MSAVAAILVLVSASANAGHRVTNNDIRAFYYARGIPVASIARLTLIGLTAPGSTEGTVTIPAGVCASLHGAGSRSVSVATRSDMERGDHTGAGGELLAGMVVALVAAEGEQPRAPGMDTGYAIVACAVLAVAMFFAGHMMDWRARSVGTQPISRSRSPKGTGGAGGEVAQQGSLRKTEHQHWPLRWMSASLVFRAPTVGTTVG